MAGLQKSRDEMERDRIIEAFRTVGECFGRLLAMQTVPPPSVPAPPFPREIDLYLLDGKAAASFLSISASTLKRLTNAGQIGIIKIGGRGRRYPREELEKYANRRERRRVKKG